MMHGVCMACPFAGFIKSTLSAFFATFERTHLLADSYSPEAIQASPTRVHTNGSSSIGWNFQYSQAARQQEAEDTPVGA
jgi:hypothetical protein